MSIVSRVIGSTTCIGNPSPLHHLRIGFRCMPLCWGRETSSINHEKGELNMYIIVTVNVVYADISTIEDWVGVWEAKCCLVIQLWPPNCSEKNQSYSSFVTYRMFVKQLCLPGLFEAHRKFLLEQLVSEWHHWFRFAGICPTHRHQNLLSRQWSKANFDF